MTVFLVFLSQDLLLAAEIGKSLLERNRELELILKTTQDYAEEQSSQVEVRFIEKHFYIDFVTFHSQLQSSCSKPMIDKYFNFTVDMLCCRTVLLKVRKLFYEYPSQESLFNTVFLVFFSFEEVFKNKTNKNVARNTNN